MPLSSLQREALQLLAGARYSSDIYIFHDRAERIAAQAEADSAVLSGAGFAVTWQRQTAFIQSATIAKGGEQTKLEWVGDSDFRFFPAIRDPLFGYCLHPVDLAIHKLFAAVGRSEPRDTYDLMVIRETVAPLSVIVWAGVEKSPGFTPEGLVAEVRRNLMHSLSAWQEVDADAPLDPRDITVKLRAALDAAEAFAARMPTGKMGALFLDRDGRAVEPVPSLLSDYLEHRGERRDHWPSSPEITQAMFAKFYGR